MAPSYLAAEILQLAELHLAVLGRLSQTFKEWTMEWLFQWPKTQESDYWPVTKIMSNLATHLTKLESVIVSTLRRPASLCDKSCCESLDTLWTIGMVALSQASKVCQLYTMWHLKQESFWLIFWKMEVIHLQIQSLEFEVKSMKYMIT